MALAVVAIGRGGGGRAVMAGSGSVVVAAEGGRRRQDIKTIYILGPENLPLPSLHDFLGYIGGERTGAIYLEIYPDNYIDNDCIGVCRLRLSKS